jgi:hypothetical protein
MTSVTYSRPRRAKEPDRTVMQGLHDRACPRSILSHPKNWEWRSFPLRIWPSTSFPNSQDDRATRELTDIIKRSCAAFRSHEVTPLVNVGGHAILVRDRKFKLKEIRKCRIFSLLGPLASHNNPLFLNKINNRNSSTARHLRLKMWHCKCSVTFSNTF